MYGCSVLQYQIVWVKNDDHKLGILVVMAFAHTITRRQKTQIALNPVA